MAIPSDEVVQIRHADVAGDPTMVTVSCPDKIGLGYDLCRVVLLFGLNILKADMSTDGRWCYTVQSVAATQRHGQTMAWNLLKERLVELCPMPAPFGIDSSYLAAAGFLDDHVPSVPQVFLLKFCCYDRMGLLHDVTRVLCEMELTIMRVKVSTTPDGRVMDLFFITDARELLHTKSRREEAYERLQTILGDSVTSYEIECDRGHVLLPPSLCIAPAPCPGTDIRRRGAVELLELVGHPGQLAQSCAHPHLDPVWPPQGPPVRHLEDTEGLQHPDLLRSVLRGPKGQLRGGPVRGAAEWEEDRRRARKSVLCSRLRAELRRPLHVVLVNRGPDAELLVANPVEVSGKGRPLVLHDITLVLKNLEKRIFLAEIGRHVVDDREWEVYRVHLGEDDRNLSCSARSRIVDGVTNILMGWD